jgi:hypothetical protein
MQTNKHYETQIFAQSQGHFDSSSRNSGYSVLFIQGFPKLQRTSETGCCAAFGILQLTFTMVFLRSPARSLSHIFLLQMSDAVVTEPGEEDRPRQFVARGEGSQRSGDKGGHCALRLSVAKDKVSGLSDCYDTNQTDDDGAHTRIAPF